MARPSEYKPLLFTTTMRNPERLKFILYVLAKFRGKVLNDDLATEIVGETIRYGLYRPMKQNDVIKQKWMSTPNGVFSEYILNDPDMFENTLAAVRQRVNRVFRDRDFRKTVENSTRDNWLNIT